MSYLERNWSGALVASALVLYVLMSMMLKEMPFFTETDVRRRRRVISQLWRDIPLPCYCELRMREDAIFTGGIRMDDDDVDRVARQVVAMYFIAVPPSVITYRYGYGEFLDDMVDDIFSERSEEYRDQLKRAVEEHFIRLAYTLDGAPTHRQRGR